MTHIGTNVAQGVAAATHTAQDVARTRDKRQAQRQRDLRRVRDAFEAHLRSLEESDRDQASPRLHLDDQLPQHSIADERPDPHDRRPHPTPPAAAREHDADPAVSADPHDSSPGLYRHLDLTA